MKKILPILVLGSFLVVLALPLIASAQEIGPTECCKLRRAITDVDSACTAGKIVGPSALPVCTATTTTSCCGVGAVTAITDNWGMCCLINTLYNITDWIFVILVAIVILFVLIGAFSILTAGGSPDKVTTGRNYIMYAMIGLAVAIMAKAIPGVVKLIVGV